MKKYNATKHDVEQAKELLAQGYNYIARNDNGTLYAYENEPIPAFSEKSEIRYFWVSGSKSKIVKNADFEFVTWKDNQPTLISDIVEDSEED